MSYEIMQGGLIFPSPENQWQVDFVNTLNPWITCVNSYISDIGGSSAGLSFGDGFSVTCDGSITATEGSIAGWCIKTCHLCSANILIDSCTEQIKVGNRDGVYIDIDGSNDRIRTSDFVSGAMGEGWQIGTDVTEFQNIRARGRLTASVFEKESVSAVGGNLAILDSAVLCEDMTALDASCLVTDGSTTFSANDTLRIKTGNDDEWFKVCCNVSGSTYCVIRDMDSQYNVDTNPAWQSGSAVVNYGQCNAGGMLLTSSEVCSPYIGIFTHQCEPWSSVSNKVRLGNLSGVTSSFFGTLSGYGLWAETAYIEGNIVSCSAKFIDPACADNYSCIDAGALKFHDALGDVPYVKRICSGIATAGDTIILNGWCASPEVITSPNALMSYNPTIGGCQSWSLYSDTPEWYCTSSTCYGYCFDVHAALETTGSTCTACTQNVNFDTCVLTYDNVCNTRLGMKFQIWCNDAPPACYEYGCICYVICYRCNGCGTWQGSCAYTYEHTHDSEVNLKTDYTVYVDLDLPSAECWQLMATQTGLTYYTTSICAGSSTPACCQRTAGAGSVSSLAWHCAPNSGCLQCTDSDSTNVSFTGSNPSNVYCVLLTYASGCTSNNINNICLNPTFCQEKTCGIGCVHIFGCTLGSVNMYCCQPASANTTCCCWSSCRSNVDLTAYSACNFENLSMSTYAYVCTGFYGCTGCSIVSSQVCLLSATLIQCYNVISGDAAACCTAKLLNTCDTTGATCTVDGSGQVNWIAVSYS